MQNNRLNTVRSLLAVAVTGVVALIAGSAASLLPESALDGVHLGILVTGAIIVPIYWLWLRHQGRSPASKKARAFRIHSLAGLVSGILFSIIFLTGVLLLYRPEIEQPGFEEFAVNPSQSYASVDEWLTTVNSSIPLETSHRIDVRWPANLQAPVQVSVSGPDGSGRYYLNPYTAELVDGSPKGGMNLVRRIHVALAAGTVGHWIVGLVGLFTIWLCISGVTMGRRMFREWYLVRLRSGSNTLFKDLHKRIGLLLLPFIALNGIAGMLAAFFGFFAAGPMHLRFDGSFSALYEAVGSPQYVRRSEQTSPPDASNFIDIALEKMPESAVSDLRILAYGDVNSIINVKSSVREELAPNSASQVINFRAATGEIILLKQARSSGMPDRISMAFAAFHFAQYGPAWVRLLHAILATLAAILPLLGIMMWLQRRNRS